MLGLRGDILSTFLVLIAGTWFVHACSKAEYVAGSGKQSATQTSDTLPADGISGDAVGNAPQSEDPERNALPQGFTDKKGQNELAVSGVKGDLNGRPVIDYGQDFEVSWRLREVTAGQLEIVSSDKTIAWQSDITILPNGSQVIETDSAGREIFPGVYQVTLRGKTSPEKGIVLTIPLVVRPVVHIGVADTLDPAKNSQVELFVPAGGDRVELFIGTATTPIATIENVGPGRYPAELGDDLAPGNYVLSAFVEKNQILGLPDRKEIRVQGNGSVTDQEGKEGDKEGDKDQDPDDGGSDEGCPDPIVCAKKELDNKCKDAKEKWIELQFSPTRHCPFGQDDNLTEKNHFLRARKEVYRDLKPSDGHILCDVEEIYSEEYIRYDDHIIATFDQLVLLSSFDSFYNELDSVGGFYVYDWLKVRGKDGHDLSADFDSMPFCVEQGAGTCSFPGHDAYGQLRVEFRAETTRALVAAGIALGMNTHRVGLVLFGDNDDGDCELVVKDRKELKFRVKIREAEAQ